MKKVIRLFDYHRIISIAKMRERLTFEKSSAFRNIMLSSAFFFSQSQSFLSRSFNKLNDLEITEKLSKKRKSVDAEKISFKRSRFNSQSSDKVKRKNEINNQTTSLYTHDHSSFDNRIFRCLIISPADRAFRDFQSKLKLLKTLRNAIKTHRFLYIKEKILHRDISKNNVIITESKKVDDFREMLIDENFVKKIGSGRSDARHQTDTMKFMTIQVLQRVDHTYRHDLESFFYVLLWMCARRAWEREFGCRVTDQPKESILTWWYSGSFKAIAGRKEHAMGVNGFEELLDEFSSAFDCVKPLCKEIRGVLFPLLEDGALFTGTPSGPPEKLYDSILKRLIML